MIWRRLEPQNREEGPVHKYRAGMVAFGDEALCVFGGYGVDTDYTNELHLYHVERGRSVVHDKMNGR